MNTSFLVYAGAGGLDSDVVAQSILHGVKTATSSTHLKFLSKIRLVLLKINVFLAFKHQITQIFPHAEINTGNEKFILVLTSRYFMVIKYSTYLSSYTMFWVSVSGASTTFLSVH